MTLSVHMVQPLRDEKARDALTDRLVPSVRLSTGNEIDTPSEIQVLVTGRPQRAQISGCPALTTLVIPWAGISEATRNLMLEFPQIAVHNLHHNALPVAEHAIALLLAAAKRVVPMDRSLRSQDWRPRYEGVPSLLLQGKRALVLGYGAVGRRVAGLARNLGMEVTAVQRRPRPTASPSGTADVSVAPLVELPDLLPKTQVLLVCLPQTPETEGIIGARELSLLPRDAVLVNVGRGPVVDEGALYAALSRGRLFAAGLDVWYTYPESEKSRSSTAPSRFPFQELDNVVMSPHRASASDETECLRAKHLAELLNAAARGEPMPNRMDLELGY